MAEVGEKAVVIALLDGAFPGDLQRDGLQHLVEYVTLQIGLFGKTVEIKVAEGIATHLQLMHPGVGDYCADGFILGQGPQRLLISPSHIEGLSVVDAVQDQHCGASQLRYHPGDLRKTGPFNNRAGQHFVDLEGAAQQGGLPAQQLIGYGLCDVRELHRGRQLDKRQPVGVGLFYHKGGNLPQILGWFHAHCGKPALG